MLFSLKKGYHAYVNTKLHVDKHAAITIISHFWMSYYENIPLWNGAFIIKVAEL